MYKIRFSRWDANSGTSAQTHTCKSAYEREMQHPLQVTFHRTNNATCNDGKVSRSREQVRSDKGKRELTPGVIQTGSQKQRIPSAPTFVERSTEWTVSMEERQENRHRFLNIRPASNVFSFSISASKESEIHLDSGVFPPFDSSKLFDSKTRHD